MRINNSVREALDNTNEIIIQIGILHYMLFYIICYFTLNDRRSTRAAEKVQKRISNRKTKLHWFIFKDHTKIIYLVEYLIFHYY